MATTPKTILEHTDDMLALKSGTWIVTTADVLACPWPSGGQCVLPKGMRLRVNEPDRVGIGSITVLAENAEEFRLQRRDLANVDLAPELQKFKILVSQMVEQIGEFEIEAESAEEAHAKANGMFLFEEISEWEAGEIADKARIYAIQDGEGETLLEF